MIDTCDIEPRTAFGVSPANEEVNTFAIFLCHRYPQPYRSNTVSLVDGFMEVYHRLRHFAGILNDI